MRALIVPLAGVCLAFGLQASEWSSHQEAAHAAMLRQDYNAASTLYGESVSLSATPAERAASLASYGVALSRANRNVEARAALEQAMTAGPVDKSVVSVSLASVERNLGDYQSAERVLRAAAQDASATPGGKATVFVNLADLLREENRESEASETLNEAMQLSDVPRAQRISVLVEKAELAREMHQWQNSITDWNKVGEIVASDHSKRLEEVYTGGLGDTWFVAGDLTRAEPLLRRSLELMRGDPESSPSQLAVALTLMARLYLSQNKLALAGEAIDEAISKDVVAVGWDHPQTAMMLEMRAGILSRRGEVEPARDDLEHARSIMTSHFGPESAAVGAVVAEMGDVEQRANRPAVAAADYGFAMRVLRAAGVDSARIGAALVTPYAAALKAAHRGAEAKALLAGGR